MNRNKASGFTMLEVLVAVVIVSLGMLGVGAALATVHRSTSSSYLAQQSAQLASDIVERMRQNPSAAQALDYNVSYVGGSVAAPAVLCQPPPGAPCTDAQMAAYDTWQWLHQVGETLPNANATVTVAVTPTATYDATVVVSYDDASAAAALKSSTPRRSFELETLL